MGITIRELGNQLLLNIDGVKTVAYPTQGGIWVVKTTPGDGGGENPDPDPNPQPGNGQFSLPFSFSTVTSEYGPRDGPSGSFHEGIDMGYSPATAGAAVKCSNKGTVKFAGYNGAFGNQVRVFHGTFGNFDIWTTYNHMQNGSMTVSPNQEIAKGTKVGQVGNTGVGFGAHLHWETHLCAIGGGIIWNTSASSSNRTAINPREFATRYCDGSVL